MILSRLCLLAERRADEVLRGPILVFMASNSGVKLVAQNRRARHDYDITDTIECGIVLKGVEVKSLRESHVQLREAYARIDEGEIWVFQMHIAPWKHADTITHVDTDRKRKLLLHARQIDDLKRKTEQQAFTLIPLSLYFKDGRAKMELAVAKGRKSYDKRAALATRDANRETEREVSAAIRAGHHG